MDETIDYDFLQLSAEFQEAYRQLTNRLQGATEQQRAHSYMFGGQEIRRMQDEVAFYHRPIFTNLEYEGEKDMNTIYGNTEAHDSPVVEPVRYRSYKKRTCDFDPGFAIISLNSHRTMDKERFFEENCWSAKNTLTELENGLLELNRGEHGYRLIAVPVGIEKDPFKVFRKSELAVDRSQELGELLYQVYAESGYYDPAGKIAANLRDAVLYIGNYSVTYMGDMDWQFVALASLGVSTADPSKLAWNNRLEDIEDSNRRSQSGIFKFMQKLRYKCQGKTDMFQFDDDALHAFASKLGAKMADNAAEFTFEVVYGKDVVNTYNEEYFGSCMSSHSDYYKGQTDLYMHNPEKVGSLRIMKGDTLKGRGLVWHTDEGATFLDRIYPSDGGSHVKAAIRHAKEQDWDYRSSNGYEPVSGNDYTVTLLDSGDYPYMDTFDKASEPFRKDGKTYFKVATCASKLRPGNYYDSCTTHGEAYWDDGDKLYCDYMDRYYNEDDMVYVYDVGTYVSEDALHDYFVRINREWYLIEGDSITLDSVSGEYILASEAINTFDGEIIHEDDALVLDVGEYAGDYCHIRDERLAQNDEGEYCLHSDIDAAKENQGELFV